MPEVDSLREKVILEAHGSKYNIHPSASKMLRDLKRSFCGMKRDVIQFMVKCLVCQQVKIEH